MDEKYKFSGRLEREIKVGTKYFWIVYLIFVVSWLCHGYSLFSIAIIGINFTAILTGVIGLIMLWYALVAFCGRIEMIVKNRIEYWRK